MPKRTDIKKILVIGSGPIQIGQACEFDYSGTQALKALKEEGFETVLVNSNPATIMTDPEVAHRTYIEPITTASITKIIEKERPDALLPTVGGQTALNAALDLEEKGILKKYNIELIGANKEAIIKAEDRKSFREAMQRIGLKVPKSAIVYTLEEANKLIKEIGFPCVIRPAFTLGGAGGSVAQSEAEFENLICWGLRLSPINQILLEESVAGWKEFELEVMRDRKDNVVIICSIENINPMGVHTGDSITVAPVQTLTDKEYQQMRDAAIKAIREIGVEAGGCNVQFGQNPENGELVLIEVNPRVSRSSALASKATGFPIAKIAAKLAVGYTLDELPNDITKKTPASFEPSIDYVVTKIPRFTFEKFNTTSNQLTTQMKSVGEVMAIGRTFKESLMKAIRSLEHDSYGLEAPPIYAEKFLLEDLNVARPHSLWQVAEALRQGVSIEKVYELTKIDPWFLRQIDELVAAEKWVIAKRRLKDFTLADLKKSKELGMSDKRLANLLKTTEQEIRGLRKKGSIYPSYKTVDTCAAEFEAYTPYLYSSYEQGDEFAPSNKRKVIILGSGPNRIGQGIEFDYCCVHAALSFREQGFETIMINCNPETVSTDYDISDRLYFEPLTFEDVMGIVEKEKPEGVVVQLGGQTPLKLAKALYENGVPIWGTSPEAIDRAEDRERFQKLVDKLKLKQPEGGMAFDIEEASQIASAMGYPVLVRPSYVLGGRAMGIVHAKEELSFFLKEASKISPNHPVLIDKFLKSSIEVDVDALSDGQSVVIAGIMEHIEEAGIHSGDSSCILPTQSLAKQIVAEIERQTILIAKELNVIGLMNIQFAVQKDNIFLIEVNPRASRTVPFVSKASGIPWAKRAAEVMAGKKINQLDLKNNQGEKIAIKSPVFPFIKFRGVDTLLSPEMRSTGEVMGMGSSVGAAYAKAQISAGSFLPSSPVTIFISANDKMKEKIIPFAKRLHQAGFQIVATEGTQKKLANFDIPAEKINKLAQGSPHVVELLEKKGIGLVINLVETKEQIADSFIIRRTALEQGIPHYNHLSQMEAMISSVEEVGKPDWLQVESLQG